MVDKKITQNTMSGERRVTISEYVFRPTYDPKRKIADAQIQRDCFGENCS